MTVAQQYLDRLNAVAKDTPLPERFFLWATDDTLHDELEQPAFESDDAGTLYDQLVGIYQSWRDELTDAEWDRVQVRNEIHGGANKNWLLDEVV